MQRFDCNLLANAVSIFNYKGGLCAWLKVFKGRFSTAQPWYRYYFGYENNPNKNPVADKAIQELELELLKLTNSSSAISASILVQAVCNLNARIRHNNLSAKEMFLGRDQVDGHRLQFSDKTISSDQNLNRTSNHHTSAKTKARGGKAAVADDKLSVGSLVFIKHEGDKFHPRESYVVVKLRGDSVVLQKINNGKFSSRQYVVPHNRVFPCVGVSSFKKEKEAIESTLSSSDDESHRTSAT